MPLCVFIAYKMLNSLFYFTLVIYTQMHVVVIGVNSYIHGWDVCG